MDGWKTNSSVRICLSPNIVRRMNVADSQSVDAQSTLVGVGDTVAAADRRIVERTGLTCCSHTGRLTENTTNCLVVVVQKCVLFVKNKNFFSTD